MPQLSRRSFARRPLASPVVVLLALLLLSGCHGLLDVSDPTVIQDKDVANATGANARRLDAVAWFSQRFPSAAYDGALLSDEMNFDEGYVPTPPYGNAQINMDLRDQSGMELFATSVKSDQHLENLGTIFSRTTIAITAMRRYGTDSLKDEYLGQLFALRGTVVAQLAEDMCGGFPLNDVSSDNGPVLSGPLSHDSALVYALAQLDSALAHVRDSTRFRSLAQVVRGRVLLDLGRYADAKAAVTGVPTDFQYTTDPLSQNYAFNPSYLACCGGVADRDGGTGLPFVSANDPRATTTFYRTRISDASDSLYVQTKYVGTNTPMVVASGIEARLIEAEAALHAGNPGDALTILNDLRATIGLGALSMPASPDDQVDVVYSERAFWLFLTGRRLSDLRRLIINYGRPQNAVFPSGAYPILGLTYGSATAIAFSVPVEAQTNPHITTGCVADQPRP